MKALLYLREEVERFGRTVRPWGAHFMSIVSGFFYRKTNGSESCGSFDSFPWYCSSKLKSHGAPEPMTGIDISGDTFTCSWRGVIK